MATLRLYHGSDVVVRKPTLERCRSNNDYGQGFYCTRNSELAKEWACNQGRSGFSNAYDLEVEGLDIVDLNSDSFCLLHWLDLLFQNRLFRLSTPTMERGARWLHEHYAVDVQQADIIKGYRADDSYFGFARAFLRNEITLDQLRQAMRLGELGEQYMLKSAKAFGAGTFIECEPADASKYWTLRMARDDAARQAYSAIVAEGLSDKYGNQHTYISSLMAMNEEERYARLF